MDSRCFRIDPPALRCLPRTFAAKNGQPVELRLLPESLHDRFVAMYLAFQPRNSFQGLPPIKDEICIRWAREMIRTGVNVVALDAEENVLGHIALFPINPSKCEMLVVVSPPFQNLGIGTELTRSIIAVACELGFEKIWLPVAAANLRARHVYRKCGFQYVSDKPARELDMVLDLTQVRAQECGGGKPAGVGVPLLEMALYPLPSASPAP